MYAHATLTTLESIHLSQPQAEAVVRLVETAPQVQRRFQFFVWVQSHLHVLLPHALMVCGAYSRQHKRLQYEVFNSTALPPQVLDLLSAADSPLLARAAQLWVQRLCQPLAEPLDADSSAWHETVPTSELRRAGFMQLLVHGVSRPERPHEIETLFLLAGDTHRSGTDALRIFDLVMPHLHATYMRTLGVERKLGISAARSPAPVAEKAVSRVTARELEILHWVREGKSNQEISELLGLSVLTVKNHVQNVLRKLGASNRGHAVTLAVRMRVLPGGPRRDSDAWDEPK